MHNKHIFYFPILFLTCLLFTSCFDIVEELNMKKNGSGNIKATVNLSKSKTKVASLMKLDKVDGIKIPSEAKIRQEMNTIIALLKKTPGVSNVKHTLDFTNYVASLSCDFTDINALNSFTKTLSNHFNTKLSVYSNYSYDGKTKTLTRHHSHSADGKKEYDKLSLESKKSFDDAFFTMIYRFENDVKSSGNKLAKVSANKKAVMLKTNLPDLVNGKVNLTNTIRLEN